MKLLVIAIALGVAAAPQTEASTEGKSLPLQLRPKAGVATVSRDLAPAASPASGPDLDLVPRRETRAESSRSSCNNESALCYDASSGRIVYKPARQFMPEIPGLQRENISVKRDRIVLRYSF